MGSAHGPVLIEKMNHEKGEGHRLKGDVDCGNTLKDLHLP